jgi:hypothetical protein
MSGKELLVRLLPILATVFGLLLAWLLDGAWRDMVVSQIGESSRRRV